VKDSDEILFSAFAGGNWITADKGYAQWESAAKNYGIARFCSGRRWF